MVKAILDTDGGNCPSCRRAIEHRGQRLPGVSAITMNIANREIHVEYDGNPEVIDQLIGFVDILGYTATLRESEVPS